MHEEENLDNCTNSWSFEKQCRMQEQADKSQQEFLASRVRRAPITRIEPIKGTDYIGIFLGGNTSDFPDHTISRVDGLLRANAILTGLLNESNNADPVTVDKEIWLCHTLFKACIASGRAQGKAYNSNNIKEFEKMLRVAEKAWRERSIYDPRPSIGQQIYNANKRES